jgi:hypothetical protein
MSGCGPYHTQSRRTCMESSGGGSDSYGSFSCKIESARSSEDIEVRNEANMFLVNRSQLYRIDKLVPANTMDATTAIRFRAGRVFPVFAAILIPASVLSKKSARLSMSVWASSSPSS